VRRNAGLGVIVAFVLAAVAAPAAAPAAPAAQGDDPPPAGKEKQKEPLPASTVVVLEDQGVIPPGSFAGFRHTCPARAPNPVGGTYGPPDGVQPAGQFLLAGSYPVGRRAWHVRMRNVTPLPQPFFAGTVCVGSSEPFAYPRTTGVAPPGSDSGVNVSCPPRAPRAIGGFFRPQNPADLGQIIADSAFRTTEGWDIGVRSIVPLPKGYVAGAVCVGSGLRTVTVSRVRTIASGASVQTTLRCPARAPQPVTSVYAAADAAAAGQIVATDGFRTGARTWNTGVRNVSVAPQRSGVGVICVR
jgi:hypothetical protein